MPVRRRLVAEPLAAVSVLTALGFAVGGYHPYAEDGGLYAAGIKRLLDPSLYAGSAAFVDAPLRFFLFAPTVAGVVRMTHLSLPVVLLALHLLSIWTTLLGVWLLASQCFRSEAGQRGAVLLMAAWLTLPVAGTSLMLMDPYLTARSISLPCSVLALAATLEGMLAIERRRRLASLAWCVLLLLVAGAMHPLMAAYAAADVLLLATLLTSSRRIRVGVTVALCVAAFAGAGLLEAVPSLRTAAYTEVALTRYYWFLSRWQWYEWVGLVAPLVILGLIALRRNGSETQRALAILGVASGCTAIAIALAFARVGSASYSVARAQPLRCFGAVYLLMIVFLGGMLGEWMLRGRALRWVAAFAVLGGIMFAVERRTYPESARIEWPGAAPANRWAQAFVWISRNTPRDALFALDPHYISAAGEDGQGFRAWTERSVLPDYSKDGGVAANTPALTDVWMAGQRAQARLSEASDGERLRALQPLGVNWIVLQQQARTGFACPYRNERVQVCRLR